MCGAASWALTYPLDVIKSRLQSQEIVPVHNPSPVLAVAGGPATSGERLRSKPVQQPVGMVQCAINSYKSGGIGVFFKGFGESRAIYTASLFLQLHFLEEEDLAVNADWTV